MKEGCGEVRKTSIFLNQFYLYILTKEEDVTVKGPDASKIDKLTAEAGQVKGNKLPDLGASAVHFDVCIRFF